MEREPFYHSGRWWRITASARAAIDALAVDPLLDQIEAEADIDRRTLALILADQEE